MLRARQHKLAIVREYFQHRLELSRAFCMLPQPPERSREANMAAHAQQLRQRTSESRFKVIQREVHLAPRKRKLTLKVRRCVRVEFEVVAALHTCIGSVKLLLAQHVSDSVAQSRQIASRVRVGSRLRLLAHCNNLGVF